MGSKLSKIFLSSVFFSFLMISAEAMARTKTITKAQGCSARGAQNAFRGAANRFCGSAGVRSFTFSGARISRDIKTCGRAGRWVEYTGRAKVTCNGGFQNASWKYAFLDTNGCKKCRVKIGYVPKSKCARALGPCNNNLRGRLGACKQPGTKDNDFVFKCQ